MPADSGDAGRDLIQDAIQANYAPPGALLTGWVMVVEWTTVDGQRVLGKARSDDTPPWTAKGMLHTVLFEDTGGWETVESDDSPE